MDVLKPKVAIGVCVRNCALTIREAIESIVAQDYPHDLLEVIVVDGYSTDKTVQIVKEVLSGSDIKTRIFFEDKGLGFARQMVVDNAGGEYIIWVDGDMILPKDFVRKQVEFMEKNPKVGIAKGRYGFLKEDSLVATLESMDFLTTFSLESRTLPDVLGTSGCIYRVKAIKEVGGFDKTIAGVGEDLDIEYRVKAAGWDLRISSAYFYERRRKTWHALWQEYFWHGIGGFHVSRKKVKVWVRFPFKIVLSKFSQAVHAYQLTRMKKAFLLPLHYIFKRAAWISGFLTEFMRVFYQKIKMKTLVCAFF